MWLGVATALGACGAAASSAGAAHCGPFDAHTLAASGAARVYVLGKSVYGCAMKGSGAFRLWTRGSCGAGARVDPVVVAGKLAAYGLTRCGVDTGSTALVVRRLTDGKLLRRAPATSPAGVESYQSIGSLVLRRDGAVAWIGTGKSIVSHGDGKIEVYRAGRRGRVQLLDSGSGIRPGSLKLRGSRLSWRHGSSARHAVLA